MIRWLTSKTKSLHHIAMLIFMLAAVLCSAIVQTPAFADDTKTETSAPKDSTESSGCTPEKDSGKYVQAVVACVTKPVQETTTKLLKSISDYFKPATNVMFTIALTFLGMKVLTGSAVTSTGMYFILRLGIVSLFSYNLGGFAEFVFKIFDQLIEIVSGSGYSPWVEIDKFISKLLGFSKNPDYNELGKGIIALISSSWSLEQLIGGMITVVGLVTLWMVIGFIFEAVFIYIGSVIVIGFLIIISPMIVPFAIFNHAGQYVNKWLNLMIASIIAPVILFALLFIFVGGSNSGNQGLFTKLTDDIFAALPNNGKDYLDNNVYTDVPVVSWGKTADKSGDEELAKLQCQSLQQGSSDTASKSGSGSGSADACKQPQTSSPPATNPAISGSRKNVAGSSSSEKKSVLYFGKDDEKIKEKLLYALLNLAAFSFIMKGLMGQVQTIASSIAGTIGYTGTSGIGSSMLSSIGVSPLAGK